MSEIQEVFSAQLDAKWHTVFFDVLKNEKGVWLQIAESRPRGYRQSIVIEQDRWTEFQSELLQAVSDVGSRTDDAHSASAVRARAYAEWSSDEDEVLRFLFRIGAGLAAIAAALQRERGAVRSRLKHLDVKVKES